MSGSKDYSPDVVRRLDDIVRIRAVQQFSASDALGFIFLLKKSLRESIPEKMMKDQHLVGELLKLESRVDSLALTCL